ncbi:hypothetical protein NDU88_000204 [Pleurodeles waltl]|uniref:Uncharacterized protein n=1 Tax=Pleurodeles waltl TaxID=8319 RepID=A0AAV7S5D3_PLEWA|nr:hypothetical protein NDU88_000204 [Pleurodeles waltl]
MLRERAPFRPLRNPLQHPQASLPELPEPKGETGKYTPELQTVMHPRPGLAGRLTSGWPCAALMLGLIGGDARELGERQRVSCATRNGAPPACGPRQTGKAEDHLRGLRQLEGRLAPVASVRAAYRVGWTWLSLSLLGWTSSEGIFETMH